MSASDDKLDFEIGFMESVLRRDPNDPRVVETLAHLYTEVGRVEEGLALDERHVQLEPGNPAAHYNLACSLALRQRPDEAFARLHLAINKGFSDFDWMVRDPDLKSLRRDPRWTLILAQHLSGKQQ